MYVSHCYVSYKCCTHSEKSMFYTTVEQMHNFVLHYFTLVYISGILPLYTVNWEIFNSNKFSRLAESTKN